jgi:glyoxylase-like metal-dependent hydrolase (beta-lactamase superfamily II)
MEDRMTMLSRRQAILAGAALPFVTSLTPGATLAQTALQGPGSPLWNRFKFGSFEVTTLLAGSSIADSPQDIFGTNASPEEFAALSEASFIPADKTQFVFNPTLVNTGTDLILFDTGLAAEGTLAAMTAAGVAADQVNVVVLTHMHPDHIGGLMGADGTTPTFANARYVTGGVEHNHWSGAADEGFDKSVKPLNDKMTFLDDGGSVVSGVTAMRLRAIHRAI